MTRITILVPDPSDAGASGDWAPGFARLQALLEGDGFQVRATPWTDHVASADALAGDALVLPLLAWGYHQFPDRWRQACTTWARAGVAVANPPSVLAWNADKAYLERFADLGIAVPRTWRAPRVDAALLEEVFASTGADSLIVKPAVSGGAWKTTRVERDTPLDAIVLEAGALEAGEGIDMLVQPYLDTIASAGETSLLYFGGLPSHAVNKRPRAGDFRVQSEHGGDYRLIEDVPAGARALAEQVLAAIGEPVLYARIDMVPDAHGRWWLMEAELIEPDLYLGLDPRRGALLARAVRDRL